MQQVVIDIQISAEEYVAHYRGTVRDVVARSRDGRRIRFPSGLLQPFLLHDGIRGCFRICFNEQGKFQTIERIPATA